MQLPITVDLRKTTPIQEQLIRQLSGLILGGTLLPGTQLPSSRALSSQLGVARNTVVLAYERLTAEGYIEARSAAATLVSRQLPEKYVRVGLSGRSPDAKRPWIYPGPRHGLDKIPFILHTEPRDVLRYDFKIGRPDAALFPNKVWRRLAVDSLGAMSKAVGDYADPAGYGPLREAISRHLRIARGIASTPGQVIVVAGSQEGLNLVSRLLHIAGRTVVVEDPCYKGAAFAFKSFGVDLRAVPTDADGIDVRRLPRAGAGLAYVTPSHQFPLGSTLSAERRQELLRWARSTKTHIVEDDYDSDFRYADSPLPALSALDGHDSVIYLGTFSKSIGPSLRLGFLVVPAHLAKPARNLKALMNNGHPWLDQAIVAQFLEGGAFQKHLLKIRREYLIRRDRLRSELRAHFGEVDLRGTEGGMHLAWYVPDDFPPAFELQQRMRAVDVGIYSLPDSPALRVRALPCDDRIVLLGYAGMKPEDIAEAVGRIRTVVSASGGGRDRHRHRNAAPATIAKNEQAPEGA